MYVYDLKKKKFMAIMSVAAASLLLVACSNDNNSNDSVGIDKNIVSLVKTAGLTGDPTIGRTLPSIESIVTHMINPEVAIANYDFHS